MLKKGSIPYKKDPISGGLLIISSFLLFLLCQLIVFCFAKSEQHTFLIYGVFYIFAGFLLEFYSKNLKKETIWLASLLILTWPLIGVLGHLFYVEHIYKIGLVLAYFILALAGAQFASMFFLSVYPKIAIISIFVLIGSLLLGVYSLQIETYNFDVLDNDRIFQGVSPSSETAERDGILVRRIEVEPKVVEACGLTVTFNDCWVEAETKIKFLFAENWVLTKPYFLCFTFNNTLQELKEHSVYFYPVGKNIFSYNFGFSAGESYISYNAIEKVFDKCTLKMEVRPKKSEMGESNHYERVDITLIAKKD